MSDEHVYVGFKECGCWSIVVNDCKDDPKFTAQGVSDIIKSKLRLEKLTMEQWRTGDYIGSHRCPHKAAQLELTAVSA